MPVRIQIIYVIRKKLSNHKKKLKSGKVITEKNSDTIAEDIESTFLDKDINQEYIYKDETI